METNRELHELPAKVVETLQSLGEVKAPDALWQRLSAHREQLVLARTAADLAEAPAPDELWNRVKPVVLEEVAGRDHSRRAPVLRFPRSRTQLRRFAAAAAFVLFAGLSMVLVSEPASLADSDSGRGARAAMRAHFRSKVLLVDVQPSELSTTARGLAGALGAPVFGE